MLGLVIVLPVLYVSGGAYTETLPRPFDSERWKSTDGIVKLTALWFVSPWTGACDANLLPL